MQGDEELMTQTATCAFFGGDRPIHYSALYRGIAAGRYPKPIRVGPNTSRWLRSECRAALNGLVAERNGEVEPAAAGIAQRP
jgi:predicted DNA-binding transcriptional regulator AlpA